MRRRRRCRKLRKGTKSTTGPKPDPVARGASTRAERTRGARARAESTPTTTDADLSPPPPATAGTERDDENDAMERDGDDASSSDPDPREDDILFSALVGALSRGVDASKAREVVRQQSVPPPIGLGPSWAATAAALAEDETRRRRAREALTVRVALPPAEDEDEDDDDASTLSRSEASASSHHGNLASKLETLARRAFDGPRDRLGGKAERFADANGASLAAPQLVRASWDGARRARSKSVENARERVTNDDDPPLYNPSVAATRPRAPGVAWGPPRAPPDAIRRSATKRVSLTCVLYTGPHTTAFAL